MTHEALLWAFSWLPLTVLCGYFLGIGQTFRRNLLPLECQALIHACAEAYCASHASEVQKLQTVSRIVRQLEADVMRAPRVSGRVLAFSPDRRDLRRHTGRVVAKLREAEADLTRKEVADALSELAGLAVTIAERYVAGYVGNLLPEPALEGKQPVRDRELLRVAAAAVLVAGGVIGTSLLGLSGAVAVAAGTAWSVLVLLALFGHGWTRYLPVLDLFKPGP